MLGAMKGVTHCSRVRMQGARTSREQGWIFRELRSCAWISLSIVCKGAIRTGSFTITWTLGIGDEVFSEHWILGGMCPEAASC